MRLLSGYQLGSVGCMKLFSRLFFYPVLFILLSCSSESVVVPVEERSHASVAINQYRVATGDTLYSIAWAYNIDYRQLAELNGLSPPYQVHLGQVLTIERAWKNKKVVVKKYPSFAPQKVIRNWQWPVQGKVIKTFSSSPLGNKGVDIAGALQCPIYSSAAGEVVYSGNGIRGYGNLLIIKHTDNYLSAYAFNWRNLVKEGDTVKKGQEIATMGRNADGQILLHFEIRYNGKPMDPLNYLS